MCGNGPTACTKITLTGQMTGGKTVLLPAVARCGAAPGTIIIGTPASPPAIAPIPITSSTVSGCGWWWALSCCLLVPDCCFLVSGFYVLACNICPCGTPIRRWERRLTEPHKTHSLSKTLQAETCVDHSASRARSIRAASCPERSAPAMVAPLPVGRLLCLLVYRERQEPALELLRQDGFATD